MEAIVRLLMRGTALRICLVLWVFGYVLVELGAETQGRSVYGLMFAANIPLLCLGVFQSLLLGLLLDELGGRPPLLRWGLMAVVGLISQ